MTDDAMFLVVALTALLAFTVSVLIGGAIGGGVALAITAGVLWLAIRMRRKV